MNPAFNENQWREHCVAASKEASERCGSSHSYYVMLFCDAIDAELDRFSHQDRERAVEIAREWEYASPEELEEADEAHEDSDTCVHGIRPDCCPAGCGELY